MEEWHKQQQKLVTAIEAQNVMLQDILNIMQPVSDMVKAFKLVVVVAASLTGAFVTFYTAWNFVKSYLKGP